MAATDDFRAKLQSDSAFADQIKAAKSEEEIIAAARAQGITLTHADLAKSIAQGSSELSDEELESVSSGTVMAALLIK